jgi:GR25 family glycosyltransferase involved in LPS biosynthesis
MKLFEKFDKVYCINLDKRTDRIEKFEKQVKEYDLGEFDRFSAFDGKKLNIKSNLLPGENGVIKTVLSILEKSKKENLNSILIIEDDCIFDKKILQFENYWNNLPKDWDMIYFGGNHNLHVGAEPPKKINENVIKLSNTYAAHCIGFNSRIFNVIIESIKNYNFPLDVTYQHLQKYFNIYGFSPSLCTQNPDFSDIQNKFVDYTWLIK